MYVTSRLLFQLYWHSSWEVMSTKVQENGKLIGDIAIPTAAAMSAAPISIQHTTRTIDMATSKKTPSFLNVIAGSSTTAPFLRGDVRQEQRLPGWIEREIEELRRDEGVIYHPYKDTIGVWTAGVGHTYGITQRTMVTPELVNLWFGEDIEDALRGVHKTVRNFNRLSGPRKGVMLNMTFNLGAYGLSQFFGTLRAIYNEDWDTAALHMMHSKWARQVRQRANRLAFRMRTNEYAKR